MSPNSGSGSSTDRRTLVCRHPKVELTVPPVDGAGWFYLRLHRPLPGFRVQRLGFRVWRASDHSGHYTVSEIRGFPTENSIMLVAVVTGLEGLGFRVQSLQFSLSWFLT